MNESSERKCFIVVRTHFSLRKVDHLQGQVVEVVVQNLDLLHLVVGIGSLLVLFKCAILFY